MVPCRQGVTVVNFRSASLPRHTASIAFCRVSLFLGFRRCPMRSSRSRSLCLLLLFLLSFGVSQASAQFDTAAVVGTVHDASGAVVPDAKVTLTNIATGVSLTRSTSADGNYEFVAVRPGELHRDRREARFRDCADGQRPGAGRGAAARRSPAVGRPGHRARGRDGRFAADRNRHQPAQPGHHRHADPGTGAERPRVFGPGAADDRRAPVDPEPEHAGHAARRRVQRQRASQHLQQLHDRRRRQQLVRHEQPGVLEPGDAAAARRTR